MPSRKNDGRPRTPELRDVWDAIQYMAATGCQWKMIPNDFPPTSTVQRYFYGWSDSDLLHRINHAPVMAAREAEGRKESPTAGVIDSQSVNATECGGVSGFDAGEKVKGRKRHIITDTIGFLIGFAFRPPTFRIVMALLMFSTQSVKPISGCAICLLTVALQGRS